MNNTRTSNIDVLNNQLNYANLTEMIEKEERKSKILNVLSKIGIYTFLTILALVVLFPFYWMIISALKSQGEMEAYVPTLFPTEIMWGNFYEAMTTGSSSFFKLLSNTIIVAIMSTAITVTITILTAFAFARLEFKGKNALFGIFIATMMIPAEMLVITNFITISNVLYLSNTLIALVLPFMVSVFYIFLLRQNFKQIPNELYYAAKVDGTSDLKYLIRVMIPLAKSTIITITILNVMASWNSYVWPSKINDDPAMRTISNWVRTAFSDTESGRTLLHLQMAATVLITIPLFLVYMFLRKFIMQGVSRSGIKG